MPNPALAKMLAAAFASPAKTDAVSPILPPPPLSLLTPDTTSDVTAAAATASLTPRTPHVAPVDFSNDCISLSTSVRASLPHSVQHQQSSAQAVPASSYTTSPTLRSRLASRGPSAPRRAPFQTSASTPTLTSSRACRNRMVPCSTTRPSKFRCTTLRMSPASHRPCAIPSRTMKCVRCILRSGLSGTDGGQEWCSSLSRA